MTGVSFVITVYNKAEFLPRVVASLAAQEGDFDREFIFIDDGSADGSGDALRALTRGWPDTTVVSQENRGMSAALNAGIQRARLPFTKLLDGDDLLLPDATATLLAAVEDQGAVVAIGWDGLYDPDAADDPIAGFREYRSQRVERMADPLPWVIRRARFNPSCVLVRTAAIQAVGGCDEGVFIGDYSLNLRLARCGAFVNLDRTVFLAPQAAAGRASDDGAQILHDVNLALANFVRDSKDLALHYRRMAARRATGRAWKWARRINGASWLSRPNLLFLQSRLPLDGSLDRLCRESCLPFRQGRQLRLMPGAE